MKKFVSLFLAIVLAFGCLSMAACSKGGDEAEEKVATYALAGAWNTLKPGHFVESAYYGVMVWGQLYDTLSVNSAAGPLPRGAKSWSESADGLTLTFVLDEKSTFSDGKPVTAEDWVFSAKLLADADFSLDQSKFTFALAGTDENGYLVEGQEFGVSAVDTYTLQVKVKAPTTAAAFLTSYNHFFNVVPAHAFEGKTAKEIAADDAYWANPVTSGAWTVDSHIVNSTLTLAKRADYHMGAPKLDKLVYQFMDSSNFASSMISGSVDYTFPAVDPKQGSALQSEKEITVEVSEYPFTTFYSYINNEKVDEKARLAIDMAIDKNLIVEQLFGSGAVVAQSLVLYGTEDYNNDLPYRYNPEEAKKLLAESGWNMDDTFKLLTPSGTRASIATIVQKNLQDIGMKVDVQTVSVGALYGTAIGGGCHAIIGQGAAQLGNPFSWAYNYSVDNADGTCIHNHDRQYEQIEAKYNAATTAAEKVAYAKEAQKAYYDHALIVPIVEVYNYNAHSSRLTNIDMSLSDFYTDTTWTWDIAE